MIFRGKATEQMLSGILNSIDADVIVTREDNCKVLFMNERAEARLHLSVDDPADCKKGYANAMPELCDHCSKIEDTKGTPCCFDARDIEGHIFSVTRNNIDWIDGKRARLIVARDVNQEREDKDKLYSLAYIDQLTGVPNRQKFKDDFAQAQPEIEQGRLCGVIAMLDLDNFKNINDSYGHNAGDAMLTRLSDHLQRSENFSGHVYRLGGDEFVLFYKARLEDYPSTAVMRDHYRGVLQEAMVAYSMPSIQDQCTLSMGVAIFPEHGKTTTELLRKADIALYEAKNAGRNRIVFFEDKYEKVQKFKDLYINIEPILIKNGRTYGYELKDGSDGKQESDKMINLSEVNHTLDALGLNELESRTRYFIPCSRQLFTKTVLRNLPKDKFVIQIRTSQNISESEMKLYVQLKAYGYSIALTGVDGGNLNRGLLEISDYCKLDFRSTNASFQISLIKQYPVKDFIVTGISSGEEYAEAQKRGFKLFQGFYFEQPVVTKKTKNIDPLKVNYYRLLQLTSTDDYVDFHEISNVISSDVALSYKLLKLLNSAAMGLRSKMSSIPMAVAYLGEDNLKKWIAMLALQGVASDKPMELVRISLIRARFGEILAGIMRPMRDTNRVFLTGMLSLLHIALEKTKEELFQEIPVADDIRESLLGPNGIYSDIIEFFGHYDYAEWSEVGKFAQEHGISCESINEAYITAVKWYNDLSKNE